MLRRGLRRLGSYVVDTRCNIDWRQTSLKEDELNLAKARVKKLVGAATLRQGEGSDAEQDPNSFLSSSELTSLLQVLVSSNDRESIAAVVENASDQGIALQPWHLNQLLRSATGVREKSGAVHVLQTALGEVGGVDSSVEGTYEGTVLGSSSSSSSGAARQFSADTETAACVVTALHYFGVKDRCTHMCNAVKLLIEHGVPLAEPFNAERNGAMEEERQASSPPVYVSPVLSSLMHAFSAGCEGSIPCLLIACFVRLVGAELNIWDYVHLQQALMRDSEVFPQVRAIFEEVSTPTVAAGASPKNGASSTPLIPPAASLSFTLTSLIQRVEQWLQTQRKVTGLSGRTLVIQQCRVAAVSQIVELMQLWWAREGTVQLRASDCTVYVGFVGAPLPSLERLLKLIDDEATRRKGIGATGESFVRLFHARALVFHVLSNRIGCVSEIGKIHNAKTAWLKKYADGSEYVASLQLSNPHGAASTASPSLRTRQGKPTETFRTVMEQPTEEFAVCELLAAKDMANFFPEVPASVRAQAAEPFHALLQRSVASNLLTVTESRILWSLSIPLVRNDEEAAAAIEYIRGNSANFRQLFKAVKQMIRSLIHTVALHPPANKKMSAEAVMERRRWGMYCDARDISLTVYGQSRNGKEQMKNLFHSGNRFAAIRSSEALRTDIIALQKVFEAAGEKVSVSQYPVVSSWLDLKVQRTTTPVFEDQEEIVPRHLYDPNVYNPYPHAAMQLTHSKETVNDLFPALVTLLGQLGDQWWLGEPNTFANLLRCYIHRLDWVGAIKLSEQAFKTLTLSSALDAEIQQMFNEIGDPQGSLPFKAAAKIMDLRIKEKRPGQPSSAS